MKTKRKVSVKSRLIALMLVCWILPLVLLAGFNVYYITSDQMKNEVYRKIEQLRFNDQSSFQRLEQAIEDSRDASYDGTLMKNYQLYANKQIASHVLIARSDHYLQDHYSRDERIKMAVLWYRENPEKLSCGTYNTGQGATYSYVTRYWNVDHAEIEKLSRNLDTRVAFYEKEGRLYLVRNLYTSNYENVATLVFLLNQNYCFQNYSALANRASVTLQLDDCTIQLMGDPVTAGDTGIDQMGGSYGYTWSGGKLRIYHDMQVDDHRLTAMVRLDDSSEFMVFNGYTAVLIIMAGFVVPLILILLGVFHRYVTKPIRRMMDGAEKIEEGQLGYQLDYDPGSVEFQYLVDSFNSMSNRLEYQFNHIYQEEIALRDARIMALQSHINPHFMNNTLEIINWEARLAGNEKVSKMIEALGTLMDAGIDRKKRPEIPLSEEMVYVDAYLYIISERLGDRLTVVKELP